MEEMICRSIKSNRRRSLSDLSGDLSDDELVEVSWIDSWLSGYFSVGGLESIVIGSIRWCVWSLRPSSPLWLPHLNCLFVLFVCRVRL